MFWKKLIGKKKKKKKKQADGEENLTLSATPYVMSPRDMEASSGSFILSSVLFLPISLPKCHDDLLMLRRLSFEDCKKLFFSRLFRF